MLERFKRRRAEPTFTATLGEVDSFKQLVKAQKCLGCGQETLKLRMFARGPDGWEAEVGCSNCSVYGIVNRNGFTFKGLEKDGKLKE